MIGINLCSKNLFNLSEESGEGDVVLKHSSHVIIHLSFYLHAILRRDILGFFLLKLLSFGRDVSIHDWVWKQLDLEQTKVLYS